MGRLLVTFIKGSSAHDVTVRTLAAAGLALSNVQPTARQPVDTAAGFRNGGVEAWTMWDPFHAIAARGPDRTDFLNDALIRQRQAVADTFGTLKVIPAKVDIRAAVWTPGPGVSINGVTQ